jgi:anti-sigma factor RsiW
MTAPQIHPEDLLDRARRGSLGSDERRLLEKHLARCSACRFEISLAPALYAELDFGPGDDALVARAIDGAAPWPGYAPPLDTGRRFWRTAVLLVAGMGAVAVAAAIFVNGSCEPALILR